MLILHLPSTLLFDSFAFILTLIPHISFDLTYLLLFFATDSSWYRMFSHNAIFNVAERYFIDSLLFPFWLLHNYDH